MHIKVSLVSTFRRHGSSGPKPTKVRSTAASKFLAVLNQKQAQSDDNQGKGKNTGNGSSNSRSTDPKLYGKHDGNIQTCILKECDVSSDSDELVKISNYITNLTSNFETKGSFDLRKAKSSYRKFKDSVVERYANEYGTQLSESATTNLLTELSTKSFRYTSHQIVIVLSSDEPINGGHLNQDDNKYYLTIKSKMIYREGKQLLSDTEILAMKDTSDSSVKLSATNMVRIPAVLKYNSRLQRYEVLYSGFGVVSVVDSYD